MTSMELEQEVGTEPSWRAGPVTSMIAIATVLVAASPSPAMPFDITTVLQWGLLGIIFLCLVFRKYVVPEWVLKQTEERAQAEKDELAKRLTETREQLDKLQDVFQGQMIPALTRATEINARYNEELQRARYARQGKPNPTSDPNNE